MDLYSNTWKFSCLTTDYGEIEALIEMTGPCTVTRLLGGYVNVQVVTSDQLNDLVIGGDTFNDVVISKPLVIVERIYPDVWKYEIEFVQKTGALT